MIYVIEDNDRIRKVDTTEKPASTDELQFASQVEMHSVSRQLALRRLVSVWNNLPGVQHISKFEKRSVAAERIWRTLNSPEPGPANRAKEKPRGKKARHGKTKTILDLLQRPNGATLDELRKATRWQAHSVRGFVSGKVSKSMGLRVESFEKDGMRVYRVQIAPENQ